MVFSEFPPTPQCPKMGPKSPHAPYLQSVLYKCGISQKTDLGQWSLNLVIFLIFFLLHSFLTILASGGYFWRLLWAPKAPFYGLLCCTGPHMELGPQVCHFKQTLCKKKCSFMIIVLCIAFFALKSRFLRFLTPPPEAQSTPKVPIWTDTPRIMYSHGN